MSALIYQLNHRKRWLSYFAIYQKRLKTQSKSLSAAMWKFPWAQAFCQIIQCPKELLFDQNYAENVLTVCESVIILIIKNSKIGRNQKFCPHHLTIQKNHLKLAFQNA